MTKDSLASNCFVSHTRQHFLLTNSLQRLKSLQSNLNFGNWLKLIKLYEFLYEILEKFSSVLKTAQAEQLQGRVLVSVFASSIHTRK